jgi:hypothetical protein
MHIFSRCCFWASKVNLEARQQLEDFKQRMRTREAVRLPLKHEGIE